MLWVFVINQKHKKQKQKTKKKKNKNKTNKKTQPNQNSSDLMDKIIQKRHGKEGWEGIEEGWRVFSSFSLYPSRYGGPNNTYIYIYIYVQDFATWTIAGISLWAVHLQEALDHMRSMHLL